MTSREHKALVKIPTVVDLSDPVALRLLALRVEWREARRAAAGESWRARHVMSGRFGGYRPMPVPSLV